AVETLDPRIQPVSPNRDVSCAIVVTIIVSKSARTSQAQSEHDNQDEFFHTYLLLFGGFDAMFPPEFDLAQKFNSRPRGIFQIIPDQRFSRRLRGETKSPWECAEGNAHSRGQGPKTRKRRAPASNVASRRAAAFRDTPPKV